MIALYGNNDGQGTATILNTLYKLLCALAKYANSGRGLVVAELALVDGSGSATGSLHARALAAVLATGVRGSWWAVVSKPQNKKLIERGDIACFGRYLEHALGAECFRQVAAGSADKTGCVGKRNGSGLAPATSEGAAI